MKENCGGHAGHFPAYRCLLDCAFRLHLFKGLYPVLVTPSNFSEWILEAAGRGSGDSCFAHKCDRLLRPNFGSGAESLRGVGDYTIRERKVKQGVA